MTSGQPPAGAVPEGNVIVDDQEIDFPESDAVIASVPPDPDLVKVEVRLAGGPGKVPASYP